MQTNLHNALSDVFVNVKGNSNAISIPELQLLSAIGIAKYIYQQNIVRIK
jgi:hypothetical protein